MRRKAIENVLQVVIAFVLALIVCAMIGCTTTKYVETIKTDTLHHYEFQLDSIVRIDSIYEREYIKGDTIYKEKEVYRSRNTHKAKVDTVRETKVEYVEKPIEVEKELTAWRKFKINAGEWMLGGIVALLEVFAFLWVAKWRKQ